MGSMQLARSSRLRFSHHEGRRDAIRRPEFEPVQPQHRRQAGRDIKRYLTILLQKHRLLDEQIDRQSKTSSSSTARLTA
jgi:hypothetical protein